MDIRRKKLPLVVEPLEGKEPLDFEPIEQEEPKDIYLSKVKNPIDYEAIKEVPSRLYPGGDIASDRERLSKFEGEEKMSPTMMDRMIRKYRSLPADQFSDSPEMKAARDMEHYSQLKESSKRDNYQYGRAAEYEKEYGKGSEIDRKIASETEDDDEVLFHKNPGKWKKLKALYNK